MMLVHLTCQALHVHSCHIASSIQQQLDNLTSTHSSSLQAAQHSTAQGVSWPQ